MKVRVLPPPAAPSMARGNERGGIFDASWLPADFIGPGYAPLPIDSSIPQPVPLSVTGSQMQFESILPKPVSGFGQDMLELVGAPPVAIPQFRAVRAIRSGIFGSLGGIDRMRFARPEWTRWHAIEQARRARFFRPF